MKFTWDNAKRKNNLRRRRIDFADAERVFAGPTFTFEDDRIAYGEQRFVTLGLLQGIPVSIVHTETDDEIHIISFRKATRRETEILFRNLQDGLGSPEDDERRGY
ncbi:MAG: BrnT family toxin [Gammaproteobacteria bacterium]